jgi:ATP-dependent Clp protease ATP-binding subunit ClpA
VVLAQEEARQLRHNYIGTEHLLLGLIREENGIAASVLEFHGVMLDRVLETVTAIVGQGSEPSSDQIPFTPRAKRALEVASRESVSLGHSYVGTEHLLLGLLDESEGVAVRIVVDCGVEPEELRVELLSRLSRPAGSPPLGLVSSGAERAEDVERSWLGGLAPVLPALQRDIIQQFGRQPDSGDLLLTLATAGTRAAAALRALGVDLDALTRTVREVREADDPSLAELIQAIDDASVARQSAAERQDYEAAARHRDEERRLHAALEAARPTPEEIEAIRARLGLTPRRPPPG